MNTAITITFSESVENHVGMQKIGEILDRGYTMDYLADIQNALLDVAKCSIIDLSLGKNIAGILIIHNGIEILSGHSADFGFRELSTLCWDKKALINGAVRAKYSRHNLCFADFDQSPDYSRGLGRVYKFTDLPILCALRGKINMIFGAQFYAEGNKYTDIKTSGIGFHGDTERKIVIGCRYGAKFPLVYQWNQYGNAIGDRISVDIMPGDIYIMSEKAVGNDWRDQSIMTLRHAAGMQYL